MKSSRWALPVLLAAFLGAPAARAAEYDAPAAFATLQDAVAAAEASVDVDNTINLTEEVVFTTAEVVFDADFGPLRRLTIRPDPDAGFDRATISSLNGSQPIFRFFGADYVTLQDLDVVRSTTNANNLIDMSYVGGDGNIENVIERCRIGSNWTVPGSAGWVYLKVAKPYSVTIRNNIFFSHFPGTFDVGIHVFAFDDPAQTIRLYNNIVADCKFYGLHVSDNTAGTTIVLRNNVVANHPTLAPEPTAAYFSNVAAGVNVATSHNTAFASGGNVEQQAGAQSILLGGIGSFLLFDRADASDAFHETAWTLAPAWNENGDFFRLVDGGLLHDGAAAYGQTVDGGAPHAADVAVIDDVEGDARPSGAALHTDRGADQLERGAVAAVGVAHAPASEGSLWAEPARNPSRRLTVRFRARDAGALSFEVFDLAGRRLHAAARSARAGEEGVLEWPATRSGVLHYRVRLIAETGQITQANGRVVLIR